MEEDTIEYDLLQQLKFTLDCGNEALAIRMIEQFAFIIREELYNEKNIREAIDFMPYHLEYGNIVASKSDNDIENFIKQLKKEKEL
jgi:hypothetical protein